MERWVPLTMEKYPCEMTPLRRLKKDSLREPRQMKKFLIVRHAESSANTKGILAGRIDPTTLTASGRKTAEKLNMVLANFNPEITKVSPMLRCRQTIESAGLLEYHLDDRLIEMDYGSWSGRSLKSLSRKREWREIQERPEDFTFPSGESFAEAWNRIKELLGDLDASTYEKFLLVTHGDISKMIIAQLLGYRLNEFQRFMVEPGSHSLIMSNGRDKTTVGYLNRIESTKESEKRSSDVEFKVGGE